MNLSKLRSLSETCTMRMLADHPPITALGCCHGSSFRNKTIITQCNMGKVRHSYTSKVCDSVAAFSVAPYSCLFSELLARPAIDAKRCNRLHEPFSEKNHIQHTAERSFIHTQASSLLWMIYRLPLVHKTMQYIVNSLHVHRPTFPTI